MPGESHGQKSLEAYSPWGRKESDTTERTRWYLYSHSWLSVFPKHGCRGGFSSSSLPSQLALNSKEPWDHTSFVEKHNSCICSVSSASNHYSTNNVMNPSPAPCENIFIVFVLQRSCRPAHTSLGPTVSQKFNKNNGFSFLCQQGKGERCPHFMNEEITSPRNLELFKMDTMGRKGSELGL